MRRSKSRALMFLASVIVLLLSSWGTGTSGAQEDDHDDHDHEEGEDHGDTSPELADNPMDNIDLSDRPDYEQLSQVRYGPYSLDPAPENPDGSHGHAHSGNRFDLGVEKPCEDCYITGMIANLVDEDGNTVGTADDLQLHHMVLFNQNDGRTDATCGSSFLGFLGQRFFASGDERTPIVSQPGYGYYVGDGSFNLIWELMSMSTERETVYYEVNFLWVDADDAPADMNDLEPVWFDIDQCGDSQVSVPEGQSMQSYTWNANRSGDIVGIGGHQHGNTEIGGGTNIEITNDTTGELVCDSVAGYGESPMYVDHHGTGWLSSMSSCGGHDDPDFASPVSSGDQVTIRSYYDTNEATDDQMGIVIAYMDESDEEEEECSWWRRLLGLC